MRALTRARFSAATAILLLVLAVTPGSANAALVGYWPFDVNYEDLSATNNDASNSAYPNNGDLGAGRYRQALVVENTEGVSGEDWVTAPSNAAYNSLTEFTIETWFKTSDISNNAWPTIVAHQQNSGNRQFDLGFDRDGNQIFFSFSRDTGSTTSLYVSNGSSYADGRWHHIAGVVEPGKVAKLYLDGVLRGSTTFTGNIENATGYAIDFGEVFDGAVDEVKLHDIPLTAEEIRDIYQVPAPQTSGTTLSTGNCSSGTTATSFSIPALTPTVSPIDCVIGFGSLDNHATLRMYQADGSGSAMWRPPTGTLVGGFGSSGSANVDMGTTTDDGLAAAYDANLDRTYIVGSVNATATKNVAIAAIGSTGGTVNAFNTNGKRTESFSAGDDVLRDALVQPDGRLVAVGRSDPANDQMLVVRYNTDGSPDTSFAGGGSMTVSQSGSDTSLFAVTQQADGKIVAAGTRYGTNDDFAVIRLNTDGSLDTSFSSDGIATADFGNNDAAEAVMVRSDGRIVVAGNAYNGSAWNVALARFDADGVLDTTFDGDGKSTHSLSAGAEWTEQAALTSDGAIITVGYSNDGTNNLMTVARFLATGQIDPTFGTSGYRRVQAGASTSYGLDVLMGPDGSITAAGYDATSAFTLARMSSVGVLDTSLDADGIYLGPWQSGTWGKSLVENQDGMITIVGGVNTGSGDDFAAQRLDTDTLVDYQNGSNDWDAGSAMFGGCLRAVGVGTAGEWSVAGGGTCTAADGASWNDFPTTATGGAAVARTTTNTIAGSATLRFGVRPNAAPSGTYLAPLVVETVAPELTPPSNVTAPVISGTAQTRQTLSVDPGVWQGSAPMTYAYQWKRGGAAITGATASTYTVQTADVGSTITVSVTATNSEGTSAPATSAATATVTADPASMILTTGFEHGTISTDGLGLFDNISGSNLSMVTSPTRNGSYALRVNPDDVSAGGAEMPFQVAPAHATVRFYVNFSRFPAPASGLDRIFSMTTTPDTDGDVGQLKIDSSGQLQIGLKDIASTEVATAIGTRITLDSWHLIEIDADLTTTTWTLSWSVDGRAQPATSGSSANTPAYTVKEIKFGSTGTPYDFDAVFDDVAVSNSANDYPIGPGKVLGFTPNGTGAHNPDPPSPSFGSSANNNTDGCPGLASGDRNVTSPTAASWNKLDDWPVTTGASADLVCQKPATNDSTHFLEYHLADSSEPEEPQGVRVIGAIRESAAGTTNNTLTALNGASPTQIYSASAADGVLEYHDWTMASPPGGGAWSNTILNGLKLRVSSSNADGVNPWTDALLVEADFPTGNAPVNTVQPVVSGTARVGQVLSVTNGTWSGGAAGYSYQWQRCTTAGVCTDRPGETGSTYTVVSGDAGFRMRVIVTADNSAGNQTHPSTQSELVSPSGPTLTYLTGFEHGVISSSGGGIFNSFGATTPTISTTARTGGYSMRIDKYDGQASQRGWIPLSSGEGVLRFNARIDRLPDAGDNLGLAYIQTNSGNDAQLRVDDEGVPFLQFDPGNYPKADVVMTPGRWYRFEAHMDADSNPRTVEWSIDGVPQTGESVAEAADTVTGFYLGSSYTTDTGTAYLDDVAYSGTAADYPIGPGAVRALTVDGRTTTGHEGNFSVIDGTTWDRVNDVPFDSTADYVQQDTDTSGTPFLEFTLSNPTVGYNANGVRGLLAYQSSNANPNSASTRIKRSGESDTTAQVVYTGDMSENTGNFYKGAIIPKPGAGWTTAELNALTAIAGKATDVDGIPRWHGIMAEIDQVAGTQVQNTTAPSIIIPGDYPRVDMRLRVDTGVWSGNVSGYSYQWQTCTSGVCTDLANATSSSYLLTSSELSENIQVVVTALSPDGGQSALSDQTEAVATARADLKYINGFEHGLMSASNATGFYSQVNPTPTISTTTVKSGARSMETTGTAGEGAFRTPTGSPTVMTTRFAFRMDAVPTTGDSILDIAAGGSPNRWAMIETISGSNRLKALWYDSGGLGDNNEVGGPTISLGEWHIIDARLDMRGTTWVFDWRVDGAPQQSSARAGMTAGTAVTNNMIGLLNSGVATYWFDDWAQSYTYEDYPIANGGIVAMAPESAGTHATSTNFKHEDGTTSPDSTTFGKVDDGLLNSTADYYQMTLAGTNSYLEWNMTALPWQANPIAMSGMLSYRASGTTGTNASAKAVDSTDTDAGSDAFFSNINMSVGATQTYRKSMLTVPTVGWSYAEAEALRLRTGYVTTMNSNPYWDALMVEAYVPTTSNEPVNTSLPTIYGTAQDGQTLTVLPGTWKAPDGYNLTYQWKRCDSSGTACTTTIAETDAAYLVQAGDVGFKLRVEVTATNDAGKSTVFSAATGVVAA